MEPFLARVRNRLSETALFGGLAPEHLAALAESASRRAGKAGTRLWRRGDSPDALLLVVEGSLDVVKDSARGRLRLRRLFPADVVGISCVAGVPHSADLMAGRGFEGALLPGVAVRACWRRDPASALRAIAHLGRLVGSLSAERESLVTDDLDTRVHGWLEAAGRRDRVIRCTHDEVAEAVGATRPRVTEALRRLAARGFLRLSRGRIDLVDGAAPVALP